MSSVEIIRQVGGNLLISARSCFLQPHVMIYKPVPIFLVTSEKQTRSMRSGLQAHGQRERPPRGSCTLSARPGPGCSAFLPFSTCWRGGLLTSEDGGGSGKGEAGGAGVWRLTRSPLYHSASFL